MAGATTAGGWGWPHQKLRAEWTPRVADGMVHCARCGELIQPGEPWDLGHVDGDKGRWQGPEHRRCNRAVNDHKPQDPEPKPWL